MTNPHKTPASMPIEAWCQPMENGEHQPRQFIVYYEDANAGIAVFDNEAEAREHWERASLNWNCYLFGAMPLAPPQPIESGVVEALWEAPTHRHLKSGHLVREIGRGWAQVSAHPIEEMTAVSIYEHDGRLWVRNAVEFDDGRFEALAANAGGTR